MQTSAPNQNIQYTDQQIQDLHKEVAIEATKAGHPITAAQVNPEDSSPLENIKKSLEEATGDAVHVVGTAGTILGGEESATFVRTTPGQKFLSLAKERIKRLFKKGA